MTEANHRSLSCCILYVICFMLYTSQALPAPNEAQVTSHVATTPSNPGDTVSLSTPTVAGSPRNSVGVARQGALLAALGTAVAPFLIGLISPLITQFASMVSSAVLGKLEVGSLHNSSSAQYEAYMINMPDRKGPYLFLTAPTGNTDSTKRPVSTLGQAPYPAVRKTPKVSQHLGTVNIRPNLQEQLEPIRHTSREMKLPPAETDENIQPKTKKD